MKGFQITFIGRPMHEWLIETAETLGIRGNTVVMAAEGIHAFGDVLGAAVDAHRGAGAERGSE